jgi:hypothetical protein
MPDRSPQVRERPGSAGGPPRARSARPPRALHEGKNGADTEIRTQDLLFTKFKGARFLHFLHPLASSRGQVVAAATTCGARGLPSRSRSLAWMPDHRPRSGTHIDHRTVVLYHAWQLSSIGVIGEADRDQEGNASDETAIRETGVAPTRGNTRSATLERPFSRR